MHFLALIILLANVILNPGHQTVPLDQHLGVKALDLFDKLLGIIDDEAFRTLRAVVGELSQKAEAAVKAHRLELSRTGNIFDVLNVAPTVGEAPPELDFLPPSTVLDGLNGPFATLDSMGELDASIFNQQMGEVDMLGLDSSGMIDLVGFMR